MVRLFSDTHTLPQLAPSFFTSQHAHSPTSSSLLRFLHYPAIPPGANVSPNRAGAHSDYGSLTLLFLRKEGAEGLQILPPSEPLDSDHWRDVPVVEGGLLVNIGEFLLPLLIPSASSSLRGYFVGGEGGY